MFRVSVVPVLCLVACAAPETRRPAPAPRPTLAAPTGDPGARRPAPVIAPTSAPPSLRTRLRSERIGRMAFTPETGDYRDVARFITTTTGIPVLVTPAGREVLDSEGLTLELELVAPITVENMLNFMTDQSENLKWVIRQEVVMLTSTADAGDENFMDVYDVRDLTFPITSFIPPEIDQIPTDSLETRERPRTGGTEEDRISRVAGDLLVNLIRDMTDPDYWDGSGGASVEYLDTGYLVVNANPEMHRQVAAFLGEHR